ncbi:hypothetical protein MHB54_05935 [Paenibacillus sp. FSL M7-0802]|uniref:hypothetical protein n=1 Tax=Paenibacillus TaxID=44249 RepID=UPI00054B5F59|nr:hypothetical protein [Paenibacillus polymyxa]AIW39927.1 hypothetical protein X809_27745 [Paenibacillus polymyxa CR1]
MDIYESIFSVLQKDAELHTLLENSGTTPSKIMMEKIQKRRHPKGLQQDQLPLISFYKSAGGRGENYLDYWSIFNFDIYTRENVDVALRIADRITTLFDDEYQSLTQGGLLKGQYITGSDHDTDLENTYKYSIQIGITIGME